MRIAVPAALAAPLVAVSILRAQADGTLPIPAPEGYPADLVVVPGGEVYMGIDAKQLDRAAREYARGRQRALVVARRIMARELGRQKLRLPTFYMGRHEVTNEQYASYVKANWPKVRFPFDWWPEEEQRKVRDAYYAKNKGKNVPPFKPLDYWSNHFPELEWRIPKGQEKYPVRYVSFDEAQGYCSWAGLRLPFESEWQRALSGNLKKRYLWGDKWKPADYLARLKYERIPLRRYRAVCCAPEARSIFGLEDMIGSVWEWTQSPAAPFDGFRDEFRALNRLLRKNKEQPLFEPEFDASRYICRGGSFITATGQAQLAFTTTARLPVSGFQTTEALGFRVAKSLEPGFDSSVLWYRTGFDTKYIGTATLSLPSTSELKRLARGEQIAFDQRAIERWDLADEVIEAYHMVSFVPLRDLPVTKERKFVEDSVADGSPAWQGTPICTLFTTEPFRLREVDRTGKVSWVDAEAGMYVISYRGPGLPRDLEIALGAGAKHLRLYKKRPSQMTDQEKAALAKKIEKRRKNKKKNAKKRKKRKTAKQGAAEVRAAAAAQALEKWEDICDAYGMSDEQILAYGRREKPKEIRIKAGDIRIPVDRGILLFRKHDGDYVGWTPYQKAVTRVNAKHNRPRIELVGEQDLLVFHGGPRIKPPAYRLQFHIPIYLAKGELQKAWITHELAFAKAGKKKTEPAPRIHPKPHRRD